MCTRHFESGIREPGESWEVLKVIETYERMNAFSYIVYFWAVISLSNGSENRYICNIHPKIDEMFSKINKTLQKWFKKKKKNTKPTILLVSSIS